MVFGLGSLEQMELDETRHVLQLRVTAQPNLLESIFSASLHTKPIHGDEHRLSPDAKARSSSAAFTLYQIVSKTLAEAVVPGLIIPWGNAAMARPPLPKWRQAEKGSYPRSPPPRPYLLDHHSVAPQCGPRALDRAPGRYRAMSAGLELGNRA